MDEIEVFKDVVPDEWAGERVDQALAKLFPDYSRSRLQTWLKDGQILINGESKRPKDKVLGGEQVELKVVLSSENSWEAEDIPLNIVYEDEQLLVINKPAGMVVHPAAGNFNGTMLNALLHYAPELEAIPRAGIVHRLDKDTSGLLVVARTLTSQKLLVEQLQARTFCASMMRLLRAQLQLVVRLTSRLADTRLTVNEWRLTRMVRLRSHITGLAKGIVCIQS